ncbi:PadR family transcriptional regulator [Modestobacter sp. VKM Ac-2978]|uniref:PadR family transcriptional regulator n=1 Tax=Modestobacter sp. VKM Ac-2978 TaxID=3004132 RepID=UPI0022AADE81|nr:PadR family transcriptional regulator [Modestobacter sp. VKM Ac-2978]MCZ2849848.1 PadR family transcriptional regulator [Modestobacter sp. VKM Ac-2978]
MHPTRGHAEHPGARFHHPRSGHPGPDEGAPFRGGHQRGAAFRSGPHPGGRHTGGRGRRPRGDVRTAVLQLLTQQPMHGYQLMQAIAERSGGRWTPSPGAIYPTISQLEDEGLVTVTAESGRKLVTLTGTGHTHVAERRPTWSDPFADDQGCDAGPDLRGLTMGVHGAVKEIARTGTEAQRAAAAQVLADTRRALYLLLADGPDTPATGGGSE